MKDKVVDTSRPNSSDGGRSTGDFVWDPRTDQVFTPENSAHYAQLTGTAASFDKYEGYGFCATGYVFILIVDDEGTTTWGRHADSAPDGTPTIIETNAPDGGIILGSDGRLVIGNTASPAELRINHASVDTSYGPIGMQLDSRQVELSNVIIKVNNGSLFKIGADVLTVDWAQISVRDESTCRLIQNHMTVEGVLRVTIVDGSSAYLGDGTWDFKEGCAVQFSLGGNSTPDSRNYCHFSGLDFFSDSNFPSGMFNFITKDENGSPLKNSSEFVFPGIGDGFHWASILEKKLIAIDGVVVTDPRLIPEDYTDGDLHIHLA